MTSLSGRRIRRYMEAALTSRLPPHWRTSSSSFVPTEVTGLRLWLDADVGVTTAGGAVTAWLDQSGNGFDGTGVGTNKPTHTASDAAFNGHGSILFDAAETHYISADEAGADFNGADTSHLTMAVIRRTASIIAGVWSVGRGASSGTWMRSGPSEAASPSKMNYTRDNVGTSTIASTGQPVITDTTQLLICRFTSAAISMYVDDAAADPDATACDIDEITTFNQFTLGARRRASTIDEYFTGKIAEVLNYVPCPSLADQVRIRNYLMTKYAL